MRRTTRTFTRSTRSSPRGLLARAAAADRERTHPDTPLLGVPIALKDNLCTRGVQTTAASRMLEHYVPPYDATVVRRLEAAGAIDRRQDQLRRVRHGSSNENSAFGPTRNPWALDRIPGGSSGGSAAAVAAGLAPLALGSDTGGSIRQPAALCGVVGLKPTYGRVSRYGLIAFASSLDQIGPFARTARDAAVLLDVIAGADPLDATTRGRAGARLHRSAHRRRPRRPRSACRARCSSDGVDPGVLDARSTQALDELRAARRDARRRRAAARRVRDPRLLPGRDGRSELEPRALRRRALRIRAPSGRTDAAATMY